MYSLFSIATDLMTYWFGGKNSTITAEVQSFAERMQPPEDVVWMSSLDRQDTHLRSGSTRRLTGAEGAEFQVNTYTTNNQFEPAIAALTDGGFVVTWTSDGQDGSGYGIYGQRYTATGDKTGEEGFQINDYVNNDQVWPYLAAFQSGGFIATWCSYGQAGSNIYVIYGQRYTETGDKNGPVLQVSVHNGCSQGVATFANDEFVVTYESSSGLDGAGFGIFAQRFTATGQKSNAEFQVNSHTNNDQCHPAITTLAQDQFVIIWQDRGQNGIYGQYYTATGARNGIEIQVNTYADGYNDHPMIATVENGGFVIVAKQNNALDSTYKVYGQRYAAAGTKNGGEFQINTYSGTVLDDPVIAALVDGGFVVVWASNGQDGSGSGVYGQRFDANGNKIAVLVTAQPTYAPSFRPTLFPTKSPTTKPTVLPSTSPTLFPTRFPTSPSIQPTFLPTWWPTFLPTQSPTVLPSWFPTYLPSIQPTESPTDQPKTPNSSLAVKDRIEALFTPMVILIAAASAGGLIGLIACACFIVRSRQKTKARLAQSNFDLLPSADDFLASTPEHISPRDQRQECLREVELPTASLSGSASSPVSVETSRQISRGQLRSPSSAHVLPSTIPMIPSAELTIDSIQCLGEGGFGIVYKGTWQTTPVAVKQLKAKHLAQKVLQSFYQEAGQHGSFRHPNILLLYGICLDAPSPSMVMELMTMSLYYFLHSHEDFPWSMRLSVAKDIASGLQYLHSRRTLHRDFKSHNVLLDQHHRAKLSDFGLSKTRSGVSSSMQTSMPVGTLHWMAPEILGIKAKHTELSDVYALGMVFWEISSREFPFQEYENGSRSDLLREFIKEGERPTIPAATPPAFAALIARCWAQRPGDRPVCADIVNVLKKEETPGASSSLTLYGSSTSGAYTDFADPFLSITNTGSV